MTYRFHTAAVNRTALYGHGAATQTDSLKQYDDSRYVPIQVTAPPVLWQSPAEVRIPSP